MRVTVCGAAGEVTGSCYLVETERAKLLVDCGLFQGNRDADEKNLAALPVDPSELDAIVLTHAHLDHSGRLPLVVKRGYAGAIHGTPPSLDVCEILLEDAAHIQAQTVGHINKRRRRNHEPLIEPLYRREDVDKVVGLFAPLPYDTPREVAPGVSARLVEAGHILGSSSVVLTVQEGGAERTVLFSGDIGPWDRPILRDPAPPSSADVVFMESTYGGRDHRSLHDTVEEFHGILEDAVRRRKKLLMPVFAVGRTQQVFYHLASAFRSGRVPKFPVYLDSPLGQKATALYMKHRCIYDEEMNELRQTQQLKQDLSSLQYTQTPDDSRALNDVDGPCLIMAGAGMCNGGRILHHLRHGLERPDVEVILVGFMARHTVGRTLAEHAHTVRIFGDDLRVRARIHTLGGFSAHAGQTDLLRWLGIVAPSQPRLVLTHGEEDERLALAKQAQDRFGLAAERPELGDVLEL
ncbi:MAG: MBL fold metallo-hydrolase [Planctomycetes bacterium]|nr:MBL fold metallo-hydrolase [Planctomycetota bacterium]